MPKQIKIEDLGDFLAGAAQVTKKPKAKRVMEKLLEETKEQLYVGFQRGVSPTGANWPALKHPRPPHRNQNNKPLLDSYKLQKSVTGKTEDSLASANNEALVLGTDVEYAVIHQEGSGNIPQRQFLGFSEKIKDKATTNVADSIIQQIDKL